MDTWISSKDRLPSEEGAYLVYAKSENPDKPFIHKAWFNIEIQAWELVPSVWASAITHWMPLPEPPKDN